MLQKKARCLWGEHFYRLLRLMFQTKCCGRKRNVEVVREIADLDFWAGSFNGAEDSLDGIMKIRMTDLYRNKDIFFLNTV